MTQDDVATLLRWLPNVAHELGCDLWSNEQALQDAVATGDLHTLDEEEPPSAIAYELGSPQPDAALVRLLAVEPERRRLGAGTRTALALERLVSRDARRIYVAVPAKAGLAYYFWLRLGYRPLTQQEWPTKLEEPSAWLVRALEKR